MTQLLYLDLAELDHTALNVRTNPDANAKIEGLKASIKAHGLLQPLVVTKGKKGYHVIAGGRRLSALRALKWKDKVPATLIDENAAREASLAENLVRRSLDPIELWEAFAAIGQEANAMQPKDLAKRFGVTVDDVRQAQRLGEVHPIIREAYRAGDIDMDAIKAFGATADIDEQLRVYEEIEQSDTAFSSWRIRDLLGFSDHQANRKLKAIGEDAYVKAGGQIITDLFGDNRKVSDPLLLNQLYRAHVAAEDAKLAAQWDVIVITHEMMETQDWDQAMWSTEFRADEETEARIKELQLAMRQANCEEWAKLDEEADALKDKRVPIKQAGLTYGVHDGRIYVKAELTHTETDDIEPEEDSELEPEADAPKEGGVTLSGRASEWLDKARQDRRSLIMAGDPLPAVDEALRFVFIALRASRSTLMKNVTHINLPGKLRTAPWLLETDDFAAYQLFLEDPEANATIASGVAALVIAGKGNALANEWARSKNFVPWESTPDFWSLFNKTADLMTIADDIHPDLRGWLAGYKRVDVQEMLHMACSGETESPRMAALSEEGRQAAIRWVPKWLRFHP